MQDFKMTAWGSGRGCHVLYPLSRIRVLGFRVKASGIRCYVAWASEVLG